MPASPHGHIAQPVHGERHGDSLGIPVPAVAASDECCWVGGGTAGGRGVDGGLSLLALCAVLAPARSACAQHFG